MSVKYHISADGVARKCQAKTPEACKATIARLKEHFDSKKEASAAFEKVNKESEFKVMQKKESEKRKREKRQAEIVEIEKFNEESRKRRQKLEQTQKLREEKLAIQRAAEEEKRRAIQEEDNKALAVHQNLQQKYAPFKKELAKHVSFDHTKGLLSQKRAMMNDYKLALNSIMNSEFSLQERNRSTNKIVNYMVDEISYVETEYLDSIVAWDKTKEKFLTRVFTSRDNEKDELVKESLRDYVKSMTDSNYSDSTKIKVMNDFEEWKETDRMKNRAAPYINKFVEKHSVFGHEIVTLKTSHQDFPDRENEDEVYINGVDFSKYPDEKIRVLEYAEKITSLKTKYDRYCEMKREAGEERDPEITDSVHKKMEEGQKIGAEILKKVKTLNQYEKQSTDFFEEINKQENIKLQELGLDLFNEAKSLEF